MNKGWIQNVYLQIDLTAAYRPPPRIFLYKEILGEIKNRVMMG